MKRIIIAMVAVMISGCEKAPESVTHAGGDFQVGRLFTVDGCSVYRFDDAGRAVYFTNCNGSTQFTQKCSSKCSRQVDVSGGKESNYQENYQ